MLDKTRIGVETCWGAAGVECPKETGEMSVDDSCRHCRHWQVCYDKMMEAML